MLSDHPHVTIETQYERDLLNINASAIHIERALTNLISNALRALPEKGKITIRTENRYLDRPLKGYEEVPKGEYAVFVRVGYRHRHPAGTHEASLRAFLHAKSAETGQEQNWDFPSSGVRMKDHQELLM